MNWIDEPGGGMRSGRSSTMSVIGNHTQYGGQEPQSRGDSLAKEDDEVIDTAISPSKLRWSSSKRNNEGINLADKIRHQRKKEEEVIKARELAFDVGLIGPRGCGC